MFPSECVLEKRVRSDFHADLAEDNLRLYMLKCKDRKAEGYAGKELEIYNQMLKDMNIGVRLAGPPPAVSYLAILGGRLVGQIVAVDKTVIVIVLNLGFTWDGGRMSYLIYDAVALSLRLIPTPEDPSWIYTLSTNVSVVRPRHDVSSYALVHTGALVGVQEGDSLYLWRPSSSSPPWSDFKESSFRDLIDWSVNRIDKEFSFNGYAYWVDLLRGVTYCSTRALFKDNSGLVEFGFIPLPVEEGGHHRSSMRVAKPVAYRTMGVVCDSFIRFVSIDGFEDPVKLKNRTVTVWKLLGCDLDEPWEEEYKFTLKTMWDFEGFDKVLKDLTPMYPILSTKDADVVYLVLGECIENTYKKKFIPYKASYLLAVDMQNESVTYAPLPDWFPAPLVPCGFSQYLLEALVAPCDDQGFRIPLMKKHRRGGGNVAAAPMPTKKPRMKKPVLN